MIEEPDPEKIAKLPKWAQEYINDLQRVADEAYRQLEVTMSAQEETPIRVKDLSSVKRGRGTQSLTHFIPGQIIEVVHAGVHLQVQVTEDDAITLSWDDDRRALSDRITFTPISYQQARIKLASVTKRRVRRRQK